MKQVFLISLFLVVVAGRAGALVDVDLTVEREYLPYTAETFSHFMVGRLESGQIGQPGVLVDINGDGFQDFVRSNYGYVCGVGYNKGNPVTFYQINLPPEFCRDTGPSFGLKGGLDLDHDGESEVVVIGHTEDRFEWGVWTIDPRKGEILASFFLPGGQEVRADGIWDGSYSVAGQVQCLVDGVERTALVLCVNIGFDIEGRGVMAVDPWTGEVLWRYVTGPNPLDHSTIVVDLDKDGDGEVLILGRSPHNLHGREINGYSDNESRLFVLDSQGELLWTKRLGGWYGGGYLITADMDSDGIQEIITTAQTTPEVWGEVVVWSHEGKSLARHTAEDQYHNLVVIPGEKGDAPQLAVAAHSGQITMFDYHPPHLDQAAQIHTQVHHFINGVVDLLPAPGPEIIISTMAGQSWVLGRDFQPLATFPIDKKAWHQTMQIWRPKADLELLMHQRGPGHPIVFSKAPAPPLNLALYGSIGGLLIVLAALLFFWRKLRGIPPGDAAVLREVRLNLLEDLELSNHGAIAPLKCLRRLVWHMNAMISGLGDNQSIEVRLRETWTESVENALPHLAGILDRARLAGLAGANVDYADRALKNVAQLLGNLDEGGFQVEQFATMVASLTAETAKADDALKDLRKEVAGYFHADLAATVTRVLRANSQATEEAGVSVQAGYLAQMAGGGEDGFPRGANPKVTCLIDPKELDFVMDNLVGNALRAMKDRATRNLSVTWSVGDGMVNADVRDTGCGIPEKNRGRILDTQFSTREGGGKGLPQSRRILRKYGGGLMVLDTSVGHGTTFRVTLPVI
jgi:signal transduction histidine kinase/outer membrane protein assembly factor BamB